MAGKARCVCDILYQLGRPVYTCTRVKHGSGFITITFSVVRKVVL